MEECQKLFEGMVGCDLIKEQVLDDVKISIIARSRDIEVKDLIPFNYVFRGPPGMSHHIVSYLTYSDGSC